MATFACSPKSQSLRLSAWGIWVLILIAIDAETGWELEGDGPPLAILTTLALLVYLSSGVRLRIDVRRELVRTRRRLLGIPVWSRTREIALDTIELRAVWMRSGVRRFLVYDLVAVGRERGRRGRADSVTLDLREDLMLFRCAEARARAAGRALNLPVVMRWDAVLENESAERREPADLRRSLAYPAALTGWRAWR